VALKLTPASLEDASISADLLYATMGSFGDASLGMGDHRLCMHAIRGLYRKRGNRFSHDSTHLAWEGDRVAGLLLSFPGNQYNRRTWIIGCQAWPLYGFNSTIRFLLYSMEVFTAKETEKDEYYIAHLAVHPDFRRQGVGKFLIGQASKLAAQSNLDKLSLIVEMDNHPAITLYQNSGFDITSSVETPHLVEKFHTPGFHRMVKKNTLPRNNP
jgi:ribosomal protein S18 acetylase RimI-like enzyme